MVKRFCPPRPPIAVVQSLAVIGGAATLWLAPPAEGAMLLVPAPGASVAALNAATGAGARLLGAGRLPGSLVVTGRREAIAGAVLAADALVVAARPVLCGKLERRA
ncbi:hypothetical protein [Sphingomonas sp. Y38-1Y]|uniref:hypothetical protein n=1 Tax=Sphingomonas sp. Y38-1Y TaxID=3078265 RepID=UPI0028E92C07|nr:hypothetical protein [Sphingomonas sp. Y38-1Y]